MNNSIQVFSKNIYQASYEGNTIKFLVLYNISGNHYVGFPVYDTETTNSFHINSIDKYIVLDEFIDVAKNFIKNPVYISGKLLQITDGELRFINKKTKSKLIEKIDASTDSQNQDDLSCLKWDYKKIMLNKQTTPISNYNQGQVVWLDFGFNVGSELRKLRPAILWKPTGDKKTWNVIPLSTKCSQDSYYFHYDIKSIHDCSAKIESMTTASIKRIVGPYFEKGKQAYISEDDKEHLKAIIKAYYTFDFSQYNRLYSKKNVKNQKNQGVKC